MESDKEIGVAILDKAAMFRGIFINQVTHIETLINVHIANHFCDTEAKALEIVDLVLGDRFIAFESKRTIFEAIVKKHKPSDYKEDKKKFEKLTSVQNIRNKLAHLIIAVDEKSVEKFKKDGTLGFVKFKEKTEALYYSPKEMNDVLKNTQELIDWLIF